MWQDWQSQFAEVQQGLMLLLQQIFLLGVSQVKVLCAELCTSSFLLSGRELEEFQGEEASNLFAHDRSENSITTLPWRLNPSGSVSTFLTAADTLGSASSLLLPEKHF